jgi:hypothetical protein
MTKHRQNDSSEMMPAPTTSAVPVNPLGLSLHRDGAKSKTTPAPPANPISSAVKDRRTSMRGHHCVQLCITLALPVERPLPSGPEQYQRKSARLYCSISALGGIA